MSGAGAIIPARGGSMRIRGKNIRRFHGRPIIEYSIETAWASKQFGRVVVSTDDALIATWAHWYGAEVHKRAADDGAMGTQEVTANVLRDMAWQRVEYACCIYATAPLMLPEDLIEGRKHLDIWPFVYSVGPDGNDAGQWYWGHTRAFLDGVPLDRGFQYALPVNRVCDINTEDDWQRAEKLYEELHKQ